MFQTRRIFREDHRRAIPASLAKDRNQLIARMGKRRIANVERFPDRRKVMEKPPKLGAFGTELSPAIVRKAGRQEIER